MLGRLRKASLVVTVNEDMAAVSVKKQSVANGMLIGPANLLSCAAMPISTNRVDDIKSLPFIHSSFAKNWSFSYIPY